MIIVFLVLAISTIAVPISFAVIKSCDNKMIGRIWKSLVKTFCNIGICTSRLWSLECEWESISNKSDFYTASTAESESTLTIPKGVSHDASDIVAALEPIPKWLGPITITSSGACDEMA